MTASAGTLLLLRHGQSVANAQGLFTGVTDSPLSTIGIREAQRAALMIEEAGFSDLIVYTSELSRAKDTAAIIAQSVRTRPVTADWRLNERNYGALTGQTKTQVMRAVGPEQFRAWRRSVSTQPPPMSAELHATLAAAEPFHSLPPAALTRTESLRDVQQRVLDVLTERIVPDLAAGATVLVVAHGNSLRALCGVLDELDDDSLERLNIPTGQPLLYRFTTDCRPDLPGGHYLDEPTALHAAAVLASEGGT
ncbi:2,3-bisphosphoglycerate-dependent phosphoglycerate mutase [Plantibacter sp. Mn2098]|uniref:2,3-bisphosphoglycerate-dependent phosphoglycerate mutase n=1 Tax=Plantibacter sp. Mn2098 TaxID=3395266 RepID=UPI003BDE552B